jgi:hypothetical protein
MWDTLSRYPTLPFAIAAVVLIFWPPPRQPMVERERQARLAELARGAPERHFEERRALETYGPRSAGPYRLWGMILLVLSLALLLLAP